LKDVSGHDLTLGRNRLFGTVLDVDAGLAGGASRTGPPAST
jgi:hypothetical protein